MSSTNEQISRRPAGGADLPSRRTGTHGPAKSSGDSLSGKLGVSLDPPPRSIAIPVSKMHSLGL